ncbi:DUF421 domain-containing protein [Mesobacillus foraminis]|uniref:DUF421 domain-containing protein n=1 Tax=Mesobacillus foraminis TaxID=279826 RepID=UPI001BED1942|nr:YetF domain-containing protein [Mesobacillus foraminis]MBT2755299.1 DUF421 domain-containing protein [Mesobacillus foraminis]
MFFLSWDSIERLLIVGVLAYIGLVFLLRISGKRTLSKLNAFDLVITVSIGSTLATILLNKKISLPEGILAFFILIGLQYVITLCSVKSKKFSKLIKSEPVILYEQGNFIDHALKAERVLKEEILQAARSNGLSTMKQVKAVVLETDGSLSLIKSTESEFSDTLGNVKRTRVNKRE